MKYCLDTNIIIDILRGNEQLRAKISEIPAGQTCITPIVLSELFKGAFLAQRQQEAVELVEKFADSVEMLDFSPDACKLFGRKYAELAKEGKQTQEPDLMIGCIAMANNTVLVTKNQKDFSNIKGLKILAW